jgi:hypothetical protein
VGGRAWQIDKYEEQLRWLTKVGFLARLALGLLSHHAPLDADGRLVVPMSWWRDRHQSDVDGGASDGGGGTSPWAIAAVVALLLALASHKPSFQWLRPPFYHK